MPCCCSAWRVQRLARRWTEADRHERFLHRHRAAHPQPVPQGIPGRAEGPGQPRHPDRARAHAEPALRLCRHLRPQPGRLRAAGPEPQRGLDRTGRETGRHRRLPPRRDTAHAGGHRARHRCAGRPVRAPHRPALRAATAGRRRGCRPAHRRRAQLQHRRLRRRLRERGGGRLQRAVARAARPRSRSRASGSRAPSTSCWSRRSRPPRS